MKSKVNAIALLIMLVSPVKTIAGWGTAIEVTTTSTVFCLRPEKS
jgi:hypothetical protein